MIDDKLGSYITSAGAMAIIAFRIVFRLYLRLEFLADDWIALAGLIPLVLRLVCEVYFFKFGSMFRLNAESWATLSAAMIEQKQLGSKLFIVVRLSAFTILWSMKFCLMVFYRRLVSDLPSYDLPARLLWVFLITSYIATILTAFLECRPLHVFWTAIPNSEMCTQMLVSILTGAILNLVTDLFLVIFPLQIVFKIKANLFKKIQLTLLFGVGFLVIATQIPRIIQQSFPSNEAKYNYTLHQDPTHKLKKQGNLLCAIEIICAVFVANACAIKSLFTKWKSMKKKEFPQNEVA